MNIINKYCYISTDIGRLSSWLLVPIVVVIGVLVLVELAQAEDATSTNFISRDPVMSIFGGNSTSASFEQLNAGGQIVVGESTSTSFILRSGFLYFDTYTPRSQNWQWFDDETNETPTTSLAAENVAPTNVVNGNIIKLRLTINEIAGVADTDIKFKIQFSESSDFSQGVSDVVSTTTCASNSLWCYGDGVDTDNDSITTLVLTDSTAAGTHNEGTTTSAFDPAASTATEFEFTIKHAGARANATYFFRAFDVTNNKAVSLNTEETFPSLSIEGTTLTFTIDGLAISTVTEGITTDVSTTPTGIPFGTLSFDTETEAAQRLTVDTNATEGYQIFIFERQGFLHSAYSAVEIDAVTGTNASPTGWSTGCVSSASGCYGYHAGDDSLDSGSTRFAANNTYAQFSTTTAEEIAFNSGPVTSEATDIVFKTKITNQQEAGDYSSSVVYIVVPTF